MVRTLISGRVDRGSCDVGSRGPHPKMNQVVRRLISVPTLLRPGIRRRGTGVTDSSNVVTTLPRRLHSGWSDSRVDSWSKHCIVSWVYIDSLPHVTEVTPDLGPRSLHLLLSFCPVTLTSYFGPLSLGRYLTLTLSEDLVPVETGFSGDGE